MPRKVNALLPQPSFSEPVFSEGVPTADPTGFKVTPEDEQLYNGIEDLSEKRRRRVSCLPRRPARCFVSGEHIWGAHQSEMIRSTPRLRVKSCFTPSVTAAPPAPRASRMKSRLPTKSQTTSTLRMSVSDPLSCITLVISFTTSGSQNTTMTSSTILSAIIPRRFCDPRQSRFIHRAEHAIWTGAFDHLHQELLRFETCRDA